MPVSQWGSDRPLPLSAVRPVLLPGGSSGAQEGAPAGEAGAAGAVSGAATAAGSYGEEPFVNGNLGGPQGLASGAEALPPPREENPTMYLPISTLPRLKPALLRRVHAFCQARGLCMDEFVNGVVEEAVREAEERVREQSGAEWREVQGELCLGMVAE